MDNLNNISQKQPPLQVAPVPSGFEQQGATCSTYEQSVDAFTFTLDNSASATTTLFRLFDADGLNNAISGVAGTPATSGTVTPSVIVETTKSAPIMITGFNYQLSSSATQFGQSLDIVYGEINGTQRKRPNITASAKRNSQFDPLLLTIEEMVFITSKTAIEINVIAGEIVTLTFFVKRVCNRVPCA
jgi:hypothetical protein